MPSRSSQQAGRSSTGERERLLEEVEREFWSHVVHELKTPLALLHGYASTLLERDLPEEQRRWFLQVIADQSARLSEGMDRLREVRRLERAEADGVADAAAALRRAVRRVDDASPGLRITVAGDGKPVPVRGSDGWLVRAFEELLAFTAPADPVKGVRVLLRRGTAVSISFATEGKVRLSGLELYLARRVAERFGGSLTARPGKITVRLVAAGGE
ncbi:MAG TPA: histidine kinase dimerization/phospho-acceptor domain-containing protein [Actinomycetota bacterium]|jgi:signal transduction histidine kinase|nr:histidine kinase dimerization/phospho-acceptor domain-containing protein [Actinomycetota bacterium]